MENSHKTMVNNGWRTAEENLKNLKENIIKSSLDDTIDTGTCEVVYNTQNILATFVLKKRQMMDELIDLLSHRLHLRVLFYSKEDQKGIQRSVLYSMPYPEEVFAIHLDSHQYGLVDEMKIVLYDSMEIMQKDILKIRDHASGEMLQKANDVKIIKDFG